MMNETAMQDTMLFFDQHQGVYPLDRVAYLVGHHHTYTNIDGMDYQILVEADFLVNLYEDSVPKAAAQNALDKIFKTQTGKTICKEMFVL